MRMLVAMSGGVDSSVAAALMKEAGHDVIGATLRLWQGPGGEAPTAGCCTLADSEDARRVAAQLDIPYYVLDYTEHFRAGVVNRFIDDYHNGRTPNPCVECNRTVKFSRMLDQAAEFGCDFLVTGHYARVAQDRGRYALRRGVDRRKDQSYVLSMLGQTELERVWFPVGEMDKEQTREIASRLGLRTAHKPDSQDICFVGRDHYRNFLRRHAPVTVAPGPIVEAGSVVGQHDGIAGFTIGQRRGIGVARGGRRYVVEIRPDTSTVVIGHRDHLAVDWADLEQTTWVDLPLTTGGPVEVQYRAHGEAVAATWNDGRVYFASPQMGIAPGQTAALYQGDRVIGSGVIVRTTKE